MENRISVSDHSFSLMDDWVSDVDVPISSLDHWFSEVDHWISLVDDRHENGIYVNEIYIALKIHYIYSMENIEYLGNMMNRIILQFFKESIRTESLSEFSIDIFSIFFREKQGNCFSLRKIENVSIEN